MNDSAEEKDRSRDRSRRNDRERGNRNNDNSRDRSVDRGRDRGNKGAGHRVYVSNIPYEFRWQDLKDLFRVEVGDVQFVELFVDEKDKSKGCGIVEFADSSCVKKCLEVMQRFEVKGRKLVIKEDSGNVRDKHGNSVKRGSGGGNRDEGRFHREERLNSHSSSFGSRSATNDTYGLSPSFLESLRIDLPLCNRVFVANLEYNVDKKKLKEVFRLAGRIQKVELHTDKDGRSRGFAVVEYDHPVEAVQAISMLNNQFLYERQMTVRMDRVNDGTKLPEGLKGIGMGLGSNGEPLREVSRNLPSSNSQQSNTGLGSGILGAVPNSALQVANALTGLNNINPAVLSNLGSSGMLQAANLAGGLSGNLLGSALGGGDLSLANSLVSNPLVQTPSQLAALTNMNSSSATSLGSFGRSDAAFGSGGNMGNSRAFSSQYDSGNKNSGYGGYGNDRDHSSAYNKLSDNSNLRGAVNVPKSTSGFSRKIVVSNLPTSASYKMLHDKFSEFGEVQHFEEKSAGTMLVMYANEWQAERAIKNLDRARIDGRTIDASFYI
ncbi:heterogeneous nuclear ribonucleoprotein M-like [Harmonia axyridis]|uniref:heterogeneous nuclear ribonucleoprotein M-like n=1 Tax=Harmonia axyridis TaxID=115357 RepID=UPI001E277F1A|nr:heterogeneous nuclear ribonucleoprotein M-like [Harmonia axyridis]